VAVEATQAALTVDVLYQIVLLYAVRPKERLPSSLRGTEVAAIVMLAHTNKIAANPVAIMATQALLFAGDAEGVAGELAFAFTQMAGSATKAALRGRVVVARSLHVTTQATAAEQVVKELLFVLRRAAVFGDILESSHRRKAKLAADEVNLLTESKVERLTAACCLLGMTLAANCLWCSRPGIQSLVGQLAVIALVISLVAGYAGNVVWLIKLDLGMTGAAAGWELGGSWDSLWGSGQGFFAAGRERKEQKRSQQQENRSHELDSIART